MARAVFVEKDRPSSKGRISEGRERTRTACSVFQSSCFPFDLAVFLVTETFSGLFSMHSFPAVDKLQISSARSAPEREYWQIEIGGIRMAWAAERILSFTHTANHVLQR